MLCRKMFIGARKTTERSRKEDASRRGMRMSRKQRNLSFLCVRSGRFRTGQHLREPGLHTAGCEGD